MSRYQGVRFWILFVGLLAFVMLWPIADELSSHQAAPDIFRYVLFLSCLLAVSNNARMAILVLVLGLVQLTTRWLFEFGYGLGFVVVSHGLFFLVMLIVTASILTEVLRAREVTAHLVVGAACVYLVLAVAWAFLYLAIEVLAPGAILVRGQPFSATRALPVAESEAIRLLYISMGSITTLGNSDIPVTFLARQIATIEALTGQLYLTVLVARLVGFSLAARPT
jgi:hypothetical protein